MDNSKAAEKKNKQAEPEVSGIMTELTQEAERIIAEASEAAGREAEQELERILGEYEQKTKQIILKVREETKLKTAEIASRLSAAIMHRIEQASTRAITGVVAELSTRAGELKQKMQDVAAKEAGAAVNRVVAEKGSGNRDNNGAALQEDSYDEDTDVAEAEAEDTSQNTEPVAGIEDFDQWLMH